MGSGISEQLRQRGIIQGMGHVCFSTCSKYTKIQYAQEAVSMTLVAHANGLPMTAKAVEFK